MAKSPPLFDLEAELASDPPKKKPHGGIFDHPRVESWMRRFVAMKLAGAHITAEYVAEKLTKGARLEGIIGPEDTISVSNARRTLREWCKNARKV